MDQRTQAFDRSIKAMTLREIPDSGTNAAVVGSFE
jgi:hypothetical protein